MWKICDVKKTIKRRKKKFFLGSFFSQYTMKCFVLFLMILISSEIKTHETECPPEMTIKYHAYLDFGNEQDYLDYISSRLKVAYEDIRGLSDMISSRLKVAYNDIHELDGTDPPISDCIHSSVEADSMPYPPDKVLVMDPVQYPCKEPNSFPLNQGLLCCPRPEYDDSCIRNDDHPARKLNDLFDSKTPNEE